MPDNNTLIIVSAFSGLAGALIPQAISGLLTYLGDKRKHRIEVENQYRSKKIEIGESFYYMNGERMDMIKEEHCFLEEQNKDHQ